jgi:hypothetical protein
LIVGSFVDRLPNFAVLVRVFKDVCVCGWQKQLWLDEYLVSVGGDSVGWVFSSVCEFGCGRDTENWTVCILFCFGFLVAALAFGACAPAIRVSRDRGLMWPGNAKECACRERRFVVEGFVVDCELCVECHQRNGH